MMRQGEWLLINHVNHVRQLELVNTRCDQCREFRSRMRLEQQMLSSEEPVVDVIPSSNSALGFQDIEQQIIRLEANARKLQDYINIFTLILGSLSDDDKWFVEEHFVKGTCITVIKDMRFPSGKFHCKTTVHKMKNRIIDEVTEMCALLHFQPIDFDNST